MTRPRSSGSESRKSCNRGHWRPAEDERLVQLVEQYGPQNWNFIAQHLDGRSGKSCRLRWYNQLDPNIIKMPFSDEEEEMLLALHKVKGNKWAAIARFFPGRTDNAMKNHFHVLMARRKRDRYALLSDRNSLNQPLVDSNSTKNPNLWPYNLENYRNMGIFGTPSSQYSSTPWSTLSGSCSTITSDLVSFDASGSGCVSKAQKDPTARDKSYGLKHIACYNNSAITAEGSSTLGSYTSFTAPGIPSIGKVVPLPYNNKLSNCNNYGQRSHHEDMRKSKTSWKHTPEDDSSVALCTNLTMATGQQQQEQADDETLIKKKGVIPFIDFLGVGSSSAN